MSDEIQAWACPVHGRQLIDTLALRLAYVPAAITRCPRCPRQMHRDATAKKLETALNAQSEGSER